MSMPGMVDAAATKPSRSLGVPKLVAKGLSTGLLDIVELNMAEDSHDAENQEVAVFDRGDFSQLHCGPTFPSISREGVFWFLHKAFAFGLGQFGKSSCVL